MQSEFLKEEQCLSEVPNVLSEEALKKERLYFFREQIQILILLKRLSSKDSENHEERQEKILELLTDTGEYSFPKWYATWFEKHHFSETEISSFGHERNITENEAGMEKLINSANAEYDKFRGKEMTVDSTEDV